MKKVKEEPVGRLKKQLAREWTGLPPAPYKPLGPWPPKPVVVSGIAKRYPLEDIPYMPKGDPALLDRDPKMNKESQLIGRNPVDLFNTKIKSGNYSDEELSILFNALGIAIEFISRGQAAPSSRPPREAVIVDLMCIPGMTRCAANSLYDIGKNGQGDLVTVQGTDLTSYTRDIYNEICEKCNIGPWLAPELWASILCAVSYKNQGNGPPLNQFP